MAPTRQRRQNLGEEIVETDRGKEEEGGRDTRARVGPRLTHGVKGVRFQIVKEAN